MRPLAMHLLVTLALTLGGCVTDVRPDPVACAEPSVEIRLSLTAEALSPSDPAACRDQEVSLRVTSQVEGFLHIHGYDDEVPATPVAAGETVMRFTAGRSGQFPIEFHPADEPEGIELGVFTVHEP